MNFMKWDTGNCRADVAAELSDGLGISMLAAKVLSSRGIYSCELASRFLDTKLTSLNDPMLLKDMDRAVERIEVAVESGEKIAVYGDYDVDGITSTYILVDYLRSLGADCVYHIPDRVDEGYGVNPVTLKRLCNQGVTLVITVDTGITAVGETELARQWGMDMIICDHHECQEKLPNACAVVNPHRADCQYPEENLAGVGVAFKLICALEEDVAVQYLPFVCIGTIADVMPLVGENRVIVAQGLPGIRKCGNIGLNALLRAAGAEDKAMTADVVGFQLAPRINAAGRMSSASRVVDLFMMDDVAQAEELANELCMLNQQRRQTETEIYEQAINEMRKWYDPKKDHALVIVGEGWHHGVLGIVASRISERFQRPAVLVSVDDGVGKGSGRSVEGVNLFDALTACSEYLDKFGGHALAAGLTISQDKINDFRSALNDAVKQEMAVYRPSLRADFVVEPGELTLDEIRSLRVLEPYGTSNPRPILRVNNVKVNDITAIGAGKHLRMSVERGGKFNCVYFNKTETSLAFDKGELVDAIFAPEINDFRGESVQLMLRDIRPAESNNSKLFEDAQLYNEFKNGALRDQEMIDRFRVNYSDLGAVWRYLAKQGGVKDACIPSELCNKIKQGYGRRLSPVQLIVALDIFKELRLVTYSGSARITVELCGEIQKVDLSRSETARRLNCVSPTAGGRKGV